VYDKVIPNLAFVTLWTLALGVALALGLDLLLRLLRNGLLDRIGSHVDLAVGSNLFAHAMNVRLLNRPGGAAGIAATIRDFENVREFFASATFVAIIDFLFIGIFVTVLYWLVGPIAIVPLVALPVVMVLALIAQMPIGRSADRAQQMATKRQIVLVETLTGIETVKSLNAEPVMQREWENAISESARVNARVRRWSAVASNGTMLIQQAVSVVIIVWGVFLVSEGRISIGGLIAANILAARILTPLGMIAQTIFRAHYAFRSLQALSGFMGLPTEQDPSVSHDLKVTKGAVQVQDVTLTYPDARFPALNALSLKVAPAEIVVLLGKVGSGKSTLGKLLCGLIRPDSGNVTVDGVALDQYDQAELRGGVGYLPQSPELFTGTLRENLVIGASGASDQQVMKALYFAGMEGFVADSPDGLDLFVGEKGGRLSGGQQQAIALARLILRRPKLMFLDEPTNAMDQSMEALVVSRLQELNQKG
ncbi:MAG: ATP-binding cassette domain-containing protein, partial [Pseudomonadota bacterium]